MLAAAAPAPEEAPPGSPGPRLSPELSSRVVFGLVGIGAGLVLAASWGTVKAPFDAGLALVLIVAAVHGILSWVPWLRLPALPGLVSYLVYAIVLALFLLLTPDRIGAGSAPILWTRLACGVAVAVVLHRVLEAPLGQPRRLPGWRSMAVLALLPGLLGAGVLAAHGRPGQSSSEESVQVVAEGGPVEEVPSALTFPTEGPTAVADVAPPPAAAQPGTTAAPKAGGSASGRATPKAAPVIAARAPTTTIASVRPVKMLISGESTAGATGGGVRAWGQRNKRAEVEVVGSNACALQQDGDAILRDGWVQPKNGACLHLIDYTVEVARRTKPDLIVLFIGSNQLSDWLLPGQTVANHIGEPAFDQLYTRAATSALRQLTSLGIPVLFTSTPVPAWDPTVQTGAPNVPGTGPIKMNDPVRTRRLNELTTSVIRSLPLTAMVPYAERISNPDGTVSKTIRPDGVHLKQEAVPGIMDGGLEADFRSAYQQVAARVPSARHPGHHWSGA